MDPEELGVVIAMAGVAVAVLAIIITIVLWQLERREIRRLAAAQDQAAGKYQENILDLQDRMTRLLEAQARSAHEELPGGGPPDVAAVLARQADLEAHLDDDDVLIVENLGPGQATLLDVQTLGDPSAVMSGQAVPEDGYELPGGTSTRFRLALSLATPSPLMVRLTWRDANGVSSRDVRV